MNTNSKRLKIYLAIMLLLTATATALRTVACSRHLDYVSGFFTDKVLITIANIIIALTVIGMFSYLFVAPRINLRASFSTASTYVPTGVLGVTTAFLGANIFSYVATVNQYPVTLSSSTHFNGTASVIGVIAAVLAFLSIAHHFLNAFVTDSKSETRAYFTIATITFLALYAMLIYLDSTLAINESAKVLRLTSFLLCALFFLYEARISLGREMWRIYTSFGLAAAALCAYTSIPSLITYYTKDALLSYAGERSLASVEEYLMLLALFIFISARLFITSNLQEDKENVFINVLANYAKDRDEKAKESFNRYQEIFASKQLSIFDLYGGEIAVESEDDGESEAEAPAEEEKKEPMISDDAIYEAIFGKMPEREEAPEEETEPQEPEDPEEIAEKLLNAVEEAEKKPKKKKKETKDEEDTCN